MLTSWKQNQCLVDRKISVKRAIQHYVSSQETLREKQVTHPMAEPSVSFAVCDRERPKLLSIQRLMIFHSEHHFP